MGAGRPVSSGCSRASGPASRAGSRALHRGLCGPQRPYLVIGTLRDQVAYPRMLGFDKMEDLEIAECLRMAGLGRMVESGAGLDAVEEEWEDVLSGGERQVGLDSHRGDSLGCRVEGVWCRFECLGLRA